MTAKWTTPAAKYGPTSQYGGCEMQECRSGARTTCGQCNGEFCFGHSEHALHCPQPELHVHDEHPEGSR